MLLLFSAAARWVTRAVQVEAWTVEAQQAPRTFSPLTFSRRPVFDTGPTTGTWDRRTRQAEIWTVKAAP